MGLYLAVFDGESELDGVEVGSYADFGAFRIRVSSELEAGQAGSRYPILMLHSDCDGEWTPSEAQQLLRELADIEREFSRLPPVSLSSDWKIEVSNELGLSPNSLGDCFFDVDGVPLIARLRELAELSVDTGLPILFQ